MPGGHPQRVGITGLAADSVFVRAFAMGGVTGRGGLDDLMRVVCWQGCRTGSGLGAVSCVVVG